MNENKIKIVAVKTLIRSAKYQFIKERTRINVSLKQKKTVENYIK